MASSKKIVSLRNALAGTYATPESEDVPGERGVVDVALRVEGLRVVEDFGVHVDGGDVRDDHGAFGDVVPHVFVALSACKDMSSWKSEKIHVHQYLHGESQSGLRGASGRVRAR